MGVSVDDIKWTEEETNELCEYLAESMKNHIHKVNGAPNMYSFSPKTTGMALSLLIRSGKSSYNQLKGDSIVIMPSSNGLSKKKQRQRIVVGDCVVTYERQILMKEHEIELCELMCDEMKLTEDMLINVKSIRWWGLLKISLMSRKL